ncbi:MAG: hypothetical protein EAZ89_02575 [Bacteroidetes bacterium]|nr:MAG: hypothetical protein EAZ89_02575 [Bacteroidota bacterium]
MSKPDFILRLEQLLGAGLYPAPVFEFDPWVGLFQTKYGRPKYLLDSGGQLIGLNLTKIGLTDAVWATISGMAEMRHLKVLKLEENELTEFRLPPTMMGLEKLYLDENPLTFPAPEVMSQGMEAVLRFLKQAQTEGVREVYEVKLLIVGEGGAGKTTLWNLLQNPGYPVPLPLDQQPSTVGIQIKEGWSFPHPNEPGNDFLVNLWDFGGQEIQYMTHQFFLTRRSFYVLLAEGRRGAANFAYWFKIIELLGADKDGERRLPVLAVVNAKGVANPGIPYDQTTVASDYPQLDVHLHQVDFAIKDFRLKGLEQAIKGLLADKTHFPHLPLKIPTTWDKVRSRLSEMAQSASHPSGENYLKYEAYQQICRDSGIDDVAVMDDLGQLLHDLGNILHYQDDDLLKEYVVLNPQWAVNGVYAVLEYGEISQNQGRFDKAFLKNAFEKKGFSDTERKLLTALMLKDGFEVCFKAEETRGEIFIAPQLLPQQREEYTWPSTVAPLRYVYEYPFMPKGLMGRLIVRLHEQIDSNSNKKKIVWEKGMVLTDGAGARAQVEETLNQETGGKVIRIEVIGNDVESRRFLLRDIRRQLDAIHKRNFPTLKVFEKVPCCCEECKNDSSPLFFDVANLEKGRSIGVPEVQCTKSFQQVSINGLLRGIDEGGMHTHRVDLSWVRDLLSKDKIREALEEIRQIPDSDGENQVTQLLARLTQLEKSQMAGNLDHQSLITERNAIRDSILSFLETLK